MSTDTTHPVAAESTPPEESLERSDMDVSVVVIGRNEGVRLERCLASIERAHWQGLRHEVIYVDSRSSDDSMALAAGTGATALLLEDEAPCAAKARNVGWRSARGAYILFLDGDTELAPEFVQQALQALQDPELCAAWGHRSESRPEQSVYTRVLDLDWRYPPGLSLYFGGDVLVRRCALEQVDGFDSQLKAGEEPEMCARLRAKGWKIMHLDVPMTRHDLAITTLKSWALRSYRSGIAYAEVAQRMQALGDPLWQKEARRDFWHGILYVSFPILLLVFWSIKPVVWVLLGAAVFLIARSAIRCRWKTDDPILAIQYAVHSHAQKVPALWGQLAWMRAHGKGQSLGFVDYKAGQDPAHPASAHGRKQLLATCLMPLAWAHRKLLAPAERLWAFARLREALGGRLEASNVLLGGVELHGTRNIQMGRDALIYPGVYLETQGAGRIEVGDRVVLSRGVHIVAFEQVRIGDDCMVGEYSSIRDANHRTGTQRTRDSGHDSAPIALDSNVWLGRGVTVLKGVSIGADSVVGANAVVTRSLPAGSRSAGVPARVLQVVERTPHEEGV